jgi:hypothetical protein
MLAKLTAKHYIGAMAKGPKGEKRPADANQRAVMVARIATGEIEDKLTDDGKNAAAVALGRMGGKARAASMTAKKRKEIAKKAAASRWKGRP